MIRPIKYIQANIPKDATVLDMGSGTGKYINGFTHATTIDACPKMNPNHLLNLEENKLPFSPSSFDYILAMDFIEHLAKDRGVELLEEAKAVVKKRIYLLTPLWWQDNHHEVHKPTSPYFQNSFNLHKSLWSKDDFLDTGWVELGWKNRQGEYFFGYWERPKNPSAQIRSNMGYDNPHDY